MTGPSALRASLEGRYDIERELGEGGMATVYLARDVRHDRQVAVKVIRPEIAETIGTQRFLTEIKLTASLQHPHILGLIDSGVVMAEDAGGRPFYVMPFVAGETLRGRLRRETTIPVGEAVGILAEIADALAYAHIQGIVHRDIKPENILLGQGHALVADFGIGKALHRSQDAGSLTFTGVSLGTPAYMAPEQALGDPNVDAKADLYALGVVAHEMLSGRTPFAGLDVARMVAASLTQSPRSLERVVPDCPTRLAKLVLSLLERDPGSRPDTAATVRDTLRSILAELSTRASGPRRVIPGQGAAAIAVAIGLILVLGLVVSSRDRLTNVQSGPSGASRLPRSIAVLPFENVNRDSATDYFSYGMAEELISALGRLPGLRVASRTSTFALKGKNVSLADIGTQLGVGAILEGSVRGEADQIRINARLVDVQRDFVLWNGEYNGHLRNVLFLQDSIARAIAGALSGALVATSGSLLTRPRSRDPEAHRYYLLGRHELAQRKPGAMTSAARAFEAAIARDTSFAPAYAGLADAYTLAAPFESRPPREVFPLARKAALGALALDSTLAEAHTSLGMVSMFYDWDWAAAGQHLKRAVELNDSYAEGHLFYGWYQLFRGRLAAADSEMAKAHSLDPLSAVMATRRGVLLQYRGKDTEAIPYFHRALEVDSTFFAARAALALSLLRTGDRDAARRVVPRGDIAPGTAEGAIPIWVLVRLGDSVEARRQLRKLEEARRARYASADGLTAAYLALGDTARALVMLRAAAVDTAFTLAWLPLFPMFDGIRGTEEYRRVVERVGVVRQP
jgi:serine/threonine protein kinase/Tfp pilus assembly protein PilF